MRNPCYAEDMKVESYDESYFLLHSQLTPLLDCFQRESPVFFFKSQLPTSNISLSKKATVHFGFVTDYLILKILLKKSVFSLDSQIVWTHI